MCATHANAMLVAMLCGTTGVAQVQYPTGVGGWEIRVSNTVTPNAPSATIEVLGWMDDRGGPYLAFGRGNFDLIAGGGQFSDLRWLTYPFPGAPLGTIVGGRVVGVFGLQPGGTSHPPETTNPYPLWAATWRTDDFTPRRIAVRTESTSIFDVYYWPWWFPYPFFPDRFTPAYAEIRVNLGLDCYADCDTSTGVGVLDILDFLCFQNRFAVQTVYACGCDTSTGPGVCDIFDFLCFQNDFVAGCP